MTKYKITISSDDRRTAEFPYKPGDELTDRIKALVALDEEVNLSLRSMKDVVKTALAEIEEGRGMKPEGVRYRTYDQYFRDEFDKGWDKKATAFRLAAALMVLNTVPDSQEYVVTYGFKAIMEQFLDNHPRADGPHEALELALKGSLRDVMATAEDDKDRIKAAEMLSRMTTS